MAGPPTTIVLQPDGANGTDTAIERSTPAWNFGDSATLWVGPDPGTGGLARSLLRFDLSALPPATDVVNASLELFETAGGMGSVDVRRASAPWTEGDGDRAWSRVPILVRETAGVRRVREPVEVDLDFALGSIGDPARDLRVWLDRREVPSQVYATRYNGTGVASARVVFGASLLPFENQTFVITYSTNETVVPPYRGKGMGSAALWTSPPVGSGASGVSVADVDGDGELDVVYGTATGYVHDLYPNGTTRWSTRLSTTNSVPYTPQLADLDGDGTIDIVAITNDPALVRLNATGSVQWTAPMSVPDLPLSTPTLLDVDGDGVLDILLGRRSKAVDAFSGTDGAFIRTFPAGDWAYTASIFDLDGDGVGEIFFASDDRNVHTYDVSGTPLWTNAPGNASFLESSVAIGDVNGDGFADVVAGDDLNIGEQFALNATDGSVLWSVAVPDYREGGQTLADLDGDGRLEVVLGLHVGTVRALSGANGTTLWSYPGGTSQAVAPAIVDVTNDGAPEILYMDDGTTIRVLNGTGRLVHSWNIVANNPGLRTLTQHPMATPAVVDLDGDGTLEVVVPTGGGVQAFGTGGLGRDWRTYGYNWNHTHLAGDGTSPDGAPLLQAGPGTPVEVPASGASWVYRDGVTRWLSPGGDALAPEASAPAQPAWTAWNVRALVRDWVTGAFPNVGLVLADSDESTGASHGYSSSDSPNASARPRLVITYTLPSTDPTPRIVAAIPAIVRTEDSPPVAVNLSAFAADDDTPPGLLRWNVSGYDPGVVRITGTGALGSQVLTFYPQKDAWGSRRVTYWLTDPEGHIASAESWLNITPVNDPPTFDPPATFVVRYNASYAFDFGPYIGDVDNPRSELSLATDDPVHTSVSGFTVTFLYPRTYLDQWAFVGIVASDVEDSVGKVVAVRITTDTPPALVRSLPDLTMFEGQFLLGVFDLDDYFTDPNNDSLFFSFGYSHLTIAIHANHSVDIQAQSNWFGVEPVTFRGTDPQGAIAEDTIAVTVIAVNDPPVLGALPDLGVRYDAAYPFNLEPYIWDPDTPIDGISVVVSNPYVSVSGRLLVLLFPVALNGTTQPLTVTISDGLANDSRTISVTVSENWPPTVRAKVPDATFLEDSVLNGAYDLTTYFADVDNTPLFYSSGNVNVLVSINPSGIVDLRAAADWFGAEQVTFRATDTLGALAEDSVWIRVLPVDDAPGFATVPEVRLDQTAAYVDLRPYLFDVDTNVSDLILVTSSPHATIVGQGLLLNYSGDAVEDVEVIVSDGTLTNRTTVHVVVTLVGAQERLPGYLYWVPIPILAAGSIGFILYRRRQVEWALLVTNYGLLVGSVFRGDPTVLDTDVMSGMLTAILNFAKTSFSDEKVREIDEITLGDRRVSIVRGSMAYLAVVYQGRARGYLPRISKSLLNRIEAEYPEALGTLVDSSKAKAIPVLLKQFLDRAWWPLLKFNN